MSRTLSTQAWLAARELQNSEAWLVLLTLDVNGTVYRVVNNNENITSNGEVYTAYAFSLTLPTDNLDDVPSVRLEIDNVDQLLVDGLRAATLPPRFTVQVVLASQPDVIEFALDDLLLEEANIDAQRISGNLVLDDVFNVNFGGQYDPPQCPGLF